jgi:hypothetical protein
VCASRWGTDWTLDLLTTCIHHSELQVIRAPMLISTINRLPQHPQILFVACYIFNRRYLAAASNSGDFFSFPHSRRYSPSNIPKLNSFLHSLPYRTPLNCKTSTKWIALIVFLITSLQGPNRKYRFQHCPVVVGVFTDPFPTNRLHNPFV